MNHKIIQYTIQSDSIELVTTAIAELLDGIRRNEPHTRYEAYRIKGTDAFIHYAIFNDEGTEQIHRNAPYTQQFVEVVYPLCIQKPVTTDLEKIEGMVGGEYE